MLQQTIPYAATACSSYAELEANRLTARGLHRVWRVARTLADLAGATGEIDAQYVHQALTLRARVGRSAIGRAA